MSVSDRYADSVADLDPCGELVGCEAGHGVQPQLPLDDGAGVGGALAGGHLVTAHGMGTLWTRGIVTELRLSGDQYLSKFRYLLSHTDP